MYTEDKMSVSCTNCANGLIRDVNSQQQKIVCVCVCVLVCWCIGAHWWALQKRMNRSRCHSRADTCGPKEPLIKSACILAPPVQYDRTIRARRRCGRMPRYFNHLLFCVVNENNYPTVLRRPSSWGSWLPERRQSAYRRLARSAERSRCHRACFPASTDKG